MGFAFSNYGEGTQYSNHTAVYKPALEERILRDTKDRRFVEHLKYITSKDYFESIMAELYPTDTD